MLSNLDFLSLEIPAKRHPGQAVILVGTKGTTLIILGLVAPGIADLGKGAGKLLAITALIAYGSTIVAGLFSYFTTRWSLPLMLSAEELTNGSNLSFEETVTAFFSVDMPPLMGVTTALILAFEIGRASCRERV